MRGYFLTSRDTPGGPGEQDRIDTIAGSPPFCQNPPRALHRVKPTL
jgi:hypothetical protein